MGFPSFLYLWIVLFRGAFSVQPLRKTIVHVNAISARNQDELELKRALREMLHSAESNLSMNVLQADATTQVPTESLTDCVVDCGGGDPLLTSSGGVMKAIDDSISNPLGTIALFIILVLCGMIILCRLSRRRQTPDVSSYIYVSPSS